MPSDVDICNLGLGFIGADAIVASIDPPDGTVEAGHCARLYPIARRELIASHFWSFAKSRAQLAPVTNPSTVWQYAYALPSNCITPKKILTLDVIVTFGFFPWVSPYPLPEELGLFTERGSADFQIEGNVLLTNQPEAVLLFVRDITDANQFPPDFVTALGALLGSYLSGPIIKSTEGANTMAALRKTVFSPGGLKGSAAASDASNSSEAAEYLPAAISVRA